MSDSSDEDDQREAEAASRPCVESEPGPSGRGYCGFCRVVYNDLDQHLSSLRHLDSVRTSYRSPADVPPMGRVTLLERFLQDVLQHCPGSPQVDPQLDSVPRSPKEDTDKLVHIQCHAKVSSCQKAKRGSGGEEGSGLGRLSAPVGKQDEGSADSGRTHPFHFPPLLPLSRAPSPHTQAAPSVHRKAHRKTNKRKSSRPPSGSDPADPSPCTVTDPRPRPSRQERSWEAHREERTGNLDPLDQTIEEVVRSWGHGLRSPHLQQEETDSFHISPPISMETSSEDWEPPEQVVQESRDGGWALSRLTDVQVNLEDQLYSCQLNSALHGPRDPGSRTGPEEGFWTLPIEEVLPRPEHIPESFRGKNWAQIEREDEEKVENLVRQFRQGPRTCYFDSESLARYGGRRRRKGCGDAERSDPDAAALPLAEPDTEDLQSWKMQTPRRGRGSRLASRCQVVKVSRSTQTLRLFVSSVQPTQTPSSRLSSSHREAAQRTPEASSWRRLPQSYLSIITPLQPHSSLVYLLCCPSPACLPGAASAPKRCRRRTRPLDSRRLKVKYKRFPVSFYDISSNRILKNPPRGYAPSGPPPPCVRQLFRSLSPDLNTTKLAGVSSSSAVRGHRSVDAASGRSSEAPAPASHSGSERGRGPRTRTPKRRARSQAGPAPPRRSGLRRTGSACLSQKQPQYRRGRRGRGCEKSRRS